MEDHQQGPRGARPQNRQSSPASTISSRKHIRECRNSDPDGSSSTSSAIDSKNIAHQHVHNYRPTAMKWPFLISLMFASMTILALNIAALRVLPPDDRADPNLNRRDIPAMNNPEPKGESGNALLQSAANLERRLIGDDWCEAVTVTITEQSNEQFTITTSFTTVIVTQVVRRGVSASSSSVTPTVSLPMPCVPVTVTSTATLPATKGGPYMTIGTLTVTRTLHRPVQIPEHGEEAHTDGPKTPSDTATGTQDVFPTREPNSQIGDQEDGIPQTTEPGGITIIPNPPQVTSGASDNDAKDTAETRPNPATQDIPDGDVPSTTGPGGIDTTTKPPSMTSGFGTDDIHGGTTARKSPPTEDTTLANGAGLTTVFDSIEPSIVPQPPLDVWTRSPLIVTDSDGRPATTQFFDIPAGSTEESALGHTMTELKDPGGFARVILVDANGRPTATTSIEKPPSSPGRDAVGQTESEPEDSTQVATQTLSRTRVVLADTNGRPTATRTIDVLLVSTVDIASGKAEPHPNVLYGPMVSLSLFTSRIVITDSRGQPTAISSIEKLIVSPAAKTSFRRESEPEIPNGAVTKTLVDAHGVPYSTRVVITTPPRPWATTLSRSGVPWTTVTANSSGPTYIPYLDETTYTMTKWQYFIGMFLPTLITTAVSIPIRMLERNVMLLYPFHALASAEGSLGSESMLATTGSVSQKMAAVLNPSRDKMLLVMATALVLTSAVVTALSGEAVGISLHGCEESSQDLTNCAMSLSVSPATAKATLALQAFLVLVLFFITLLLRRWQSGVSTNPWSLGSMATLSSHAGTRSVILEASAASRSASEKAPSAVIGTRVFRLHQARIEATPPTTDSLHYEETPPRPKSTFVEPNSRCHSPGHFTMLTLWARLLFFAFLGGILSLVTYYQSGYWANGFEDFMAGYSFGVRFLFTSTGIAINYFWGGFFSGVSILSPFQLLASSPQEARHSILLGPPTDPFSGLWTSIRRRHGFLAITAFTACLAEFLPMLLGNVPSNASQTQNTHINSTWAAIAILAFMVLVLLGSFAVRWPLMPADPTSIVGMMHYVVDSPALLDNLDGLGALRKRERDRRVQERGLRYGFGPMKGISGQTRISVYVIDRKVPSA